MSDDAEVPTSKREQWIRGFYMLLMVFVFHVSWTVLIVMSVLQFILAVASGGPNDRLMTFGRGLSRYLGQVTSFLTYASEEIPFPFSDWPSS